MAILDHTNNFIQQELRDTSLAAFSTRENLFTANLCPDVKSLRSTGTYWKYDKEYFLGSQVKQRTPGQATPKAKYGKDKQTYTIDQYSLGHEVEAEEITNSSDVLDPFRDGARFLVDNFINWHEQKFTTQLMDTSGATTPWTFSAIGQVAAITPGGGQNYFSALPDSTFATAAFRRFNEAGSSPLLVLEEAMLIMQLQTGVRPNSLVLPRLVMNAIKNNDSVKAWVASNPGINGGNSQAKAILAHHLDIPIQNITVIDMVVNTAATTYTDRTITDVRHAKFGSTTALAAATMEWVGGKAILFQYKGEAAGKFSKTAAARYLWTGLTATMKDMAASAGVQSGSAEVSNQGMDLGNFFMHSYASKESMVHVVDAYIALEYRIVAPDLGFLLKDCI